MNMKKESLRQSWVEIDLEALAHNLRAIRERIGSTEILGVVKADAYGCGSVRCAETLRANGVQRFAVATIEEGITLREAGLTEPILILGITPDMCADLILRYELSVVVSSYRQASAIAETARRGKGRVDALVAVDTGMGRIGYRIDTEEERSLAHEEIERIAELDGLRLVGMISHFAASDEADPEYTLQQLGRFNAFYEALSADGISLAWRSIANSAAIMMYPQAYFDVVRPGIILYGCYPSREVDRSRLDLRPVMSVKANIVHIKTVPAGTAISYGHHFVTERPSRIATISIGYADGYSRLLTGRAEMLLRGQRVPVVGNICMDQCMIDVTDVPEAERCEEVTVMGRSGEAEITAEEIADWLGTIPYEVLCSFGMRLRKLYRGA